ncbi:MAG: 30S ribosomal protein S8 [Acidobacteria bacterium]|nr:30S ribosomal protein S8 [Acidobacteriota bacterium]
MMTDPIADMLARVRNAIGAGHADVSIPASNTKREIARILRDEGYVKGFESVDEGPQGRIDIELKYVGDRESAITGLKRVSSPGLRVYCNKSSLPSVLNGLGVAMISTSRGVMTDRQCREQGVGGEVLCEVL